MSLSFNKKTIIITVAFVFLLTAIFFVAWSLTNGTGFAYADDVGGDINSDNENENNNYYKHETHNFSDEWIVDYPATCITAGSKSHHCIVCDTIDLESITEIPALNHSYNTSKIEWVWAEGLNSAEVIIPCEREGCGYIEQLFATSISIVTNAEDCENDGFVTYTASLTFNDEVFEDVYVQTIDKLGHQWKGEYEIDEYPTCTVDGSQSRHCERCDAKTEVTSIPAIGHNYDTDNIVWSWNLNVSATATVHCSNEGCNYCMLQIAEKSSEVTLSPTCTENGTTLYIAKVVFNGVEYFDYLEWEITATGHNYDTDNIAWQWVEGLIGATASFTCTNENCGNVETVTANINIATTIEPKCTEQGEKTFTAYVTFENEEYSSVKVERIAQLEHNYIDIVFQPTCVLKGYTIFSCLRCDSVIVKDYVPSNGHDFNEPEIIKAPTCTEEGTKKFSCKNCDIYYTEAIKPTGHVYDSVVTEPTDTEVGYTTHTCKNCGDSYIDSIVHASEHFWDEGKITIEATCTEKGEIVFTCTKCEKTYTEEIPEKRHKFIAVVTEPTGTENGYTTHTCQYCGYYYVDSIVHASGHSLDEGIITKEPTCLEMGQKTYSCTICGKIILVEDVPATGHTYRDIITDPTCLEDGYTTHSCKSCGESYIDSIVPESGHDWNNGEITISATCTENGVNTFTCNRCGETYTEDILAFGHTEVVDKAVLPTCIEGGLSAGKHCSVCDTVLIKQEDLEPLGHDFIGYDSQPATCTEFGWNSYVTCTRCDYTTYEVIEALGHDYGDWIIIKHATVDEFGEAKRVCSHDENHVETKVLEKRVADLIAHDTDGIIVDTVIAYQPYGFATGVSLVVAEYSKDTYKDYNWLLNGQNDEIVVIYDIVLKTEDGAVQPDEPLTLKLLIPENIRERGFSLLHIHNGAVLEPEYTIEGNYAVVTIEQLSEFIFISEKPAPSNASMIIIIVVVALFALVALGIVVYFVAKKEHKNRLAKRE